jgi:hypothetical protein
MVDAVPRRDFDKRARIDNTTAIQFYADASFIGLVDYTIA